MTVVEDIRDPFDDSSSGHDGGRNKRFSTQLAGYSIRAASISYMSEHILTYALSWARSQVPGHSYQIIAVHRRVHGGDIAALFGASNSTKIERRQSGLQSHQRGE
jgi:hypothetical protein